MDFASTIRISPSKATPLYRQMMEAITNAIREGQLQPDERVPSDRELSDQLRIGRMTVRRAMTDLIREGWLYSQTGKGTFVRGIFARGNKSDTAQPLCQGFSQDGQQHGHETHAQVLTAKLVPADAQRAECLRISLNDTVVLLEQLRSVDNTPIALETVYLPYARCHGILDYDFNTDSLSRVLRKEYHHRLCSARQTVEADLPTQRECALLGIAPSMPMLRSARTVYLPDKQVIEYSMAAYRGDRYRYESYLSEHQLLSPDMLEDLPR